MLHKLTLCLLLMITLPSLAKPTLTIYTYDSFASEWGPGPVLKKAFEADCDCQLKWVPLADGVSLLNRLRMEGKNSKADIALGLDNNLLAAAAKTGLFTTSNVDTSALSLPIKWDDKLFIPYDYGYFAFIYNREKLKQPPQSLHELVESQHPWTIIYQDPRTSTPGLGLLLWMQKVYGDNAPEAWQKLAKKTVTVTKGWSEAYGLFLSGEVDMVLSYTTSPAYHIAEQQDHRYQAALFKEGHYLQVEVAGQLASSKQPKLAQQFLQFLLSQPAQQAISSKNWMYPLLPAATADSIRSLQVPVITLMFSPIEVEQQRTHWIRAWQNAVSQ